MTTLLTSPPKVCTLADLLEELGGISPARVIARPAPGTATEADVLSLESQDRLCELVDGILVEKAIQILAARQRRRQQGDAASMAT